MAAGVSRGEAAGWLSRAGAAAHVSLSVKSIDRAIRRGVVVSVLKGRRRLVERASLDAWIRSDVWLDDFRGHGRDGDGHGTEEGGSGSGSGSRGEPTAAARGLSDGKEEAR